MEKRYYKFKILYYILFIILFVFAFIFITGNNHTYAADLDEIVNYVVTVEPRTTDGSLDITYEIKWKVLDSTTEGPLSWVKIGTPNSSFDTPTALTSNIKSISKYSGSNVRIDFKKSYVAGEEVTFKYSIHQPYMYTISGSTCKYEFTPAWFTDAKVDNLTIKWNKDKVKSNNSNKTDGSYLVWNKKYMSKGEKLTATIKYDKTAFSNLTSAKKNSSGSGFAIGWTIFIIIVVILVIVLSCIGPWRRRILQTQRLLWRKRILSVVFMADVFAVAVHVLVLIAVVQVAVRVHVLEAVEQVVQEKIFMAQI